MNLINKSKEIIGFLVSDKYHLEEILIEERNLIIDLKYNKWPANLTDSNSVIELYSKTFLNRLNFAIVPFYTAELQLIQDEQLNSNLIDSFHVIKEATIWSYRTDPYYVTENVLILPNASLTIEAGVQVKYLKNVTFYSFVAALNMSLN